MELLADFSFSGAPQDAIQGSYNFLLVFISFLVALVSGSHFLEYARLVRNCAKKEVLTNHLMASFVMGTGIWGMHFIGMLAYEMDMVHFYDPLLTALSFGVAVLFSAAVFLLLRLMKTLNLWLLSASSVFLGVGISSMHYLGMAAMQMDATIYYNLNIFSLSVFLGIIASAGGLFVCFLYAAHKKQPKFGYNLIGAAIIALAICSMHYTGMAGTLFSPYADCRFDPDQSFAPLAFKLAAVILMVFLISFFYLLDRKSALDWAYKKFPLLKKINAFKIIFIISVIGFSISLYLYSLSLEHQKNYTDQTTKKIISALTLQTQLKILNQVRSQEAIEAFFYSSDDVTAEEFQIFTDYTGLNNPSGVLTTFIAKPVISAEGLLTFKIAYQERNNDKKLLEEIVLSDPNITKLIKNAGLTGLEQVGYSCPTVVSNFYRKNLVNILPIYNNVRTYSPYQNNQEVNQYIQKNIRGFVVTLTNAEHFFAEFAAKELPENFSLAIRFMPEKIEAFATSPQYPEFIRTRLNGIKLENMDIILGASENFFSESLKKARRLFLAGLLLTALVNIYIYFVLKSREYLRISEESHKIYLEEAKKARKKAEEANETKNMFLANMSHEIRTPMNSIIGMAKLLADGKLEPEQKSWADIICQSGENLLQIINDILDISKIEAGKMTIAPQRLSLPRKIEDTCQLFAQACEAKHNELVVHMHPDAPDYIHADPVRLRQILVNLVGNAVKFTNNGAIEITCFADKHPSGKTALHFTIKDSGIGIKKDKIKYIFEKFSQEKETTTRDFGGTGLGLPITKQLIELMGGKIRVTSTLGEGSAFSFFILTDTVEKEPRPEKITTPICLYTPSLAQQKSMNAVFGVFAEDIRSQNTLSFDNHDVETHIIDSAFGEDNILTFVKNCRAKGDRFKFVILRPQTSSSSATKNTDIFNGDFPKPLLPHDVAALVKVIAVWQGKKHTEIDYLNKQRIIAQESQKNGIAKAKKVSDIKIPDCRILVVDDVSFNQILMQKLLEPYGAQIQLAANGQEAVDQFKSKPFDLILMDCQMPVMDGFEATQKIRKLDGGKDTKIIALTADAMIGDREKCLSSGMDDYLNKPVRPNEIKEMIEKWVFNAAKGHKAST